MSINFHNQVKNFHFVCVEYETSNMGARLVVRNQTLTFFCMYISTNVGTAIFYSYEYLKASVVALKK
jgi:hypothetical protein